MKSIQHYSRFTYIRISGMLLFLWLLSFSESKAQPIGINFTDTQSVYLQSTQLYFFDSLRVNYGLKNIGNQPIATTAVLNILVLDSAGNQTFLGSIDTFVVSLSPGDTTQRMVSSMEINPTRFSAGGGVVVIWPSIPAQGVSDTVKIPIEVSWNPSSRSPLYFPSEVNRIYPNPTSGKIYLDKTGNAELPIRIMIKDLQGRIVLELIPDQTGYLNISELSPGCYWLESVFTSDLQTVQRILKQ